jgi:2-polyprenyl-6-methoxyphenol hydroxylase-like FAD-dependent oxidoreductase
MCAIFGRTPFTRQGEQLLSDDMVGNGVLAIAPDQRAVFFTSIRFREPPDRAAARLAPDLALEPREDYIMWAVVFPQSRRDFSEITATGPALQDAAEELASGFHDDFLRIVKGGDASDTLFVPIRTSTPVAAWETGRVTLLGDAIHCMPPFGAHGANTALRDASTLAQQLIHAARGETDVRRAIHAYESDMLRYGFDAVQDAVANMKQSMGSA